MKIITDAFKPFEYFAQEENTWPWIESYADEDEYQELDFICQYLLGDIKKEQLPLTVQSLSSKELSENYKQRFPVMFGKALQKIGKELENGQSTMGLAGI